MKRVMLSAAIVAGLGLLAGAPVGAQDDEWRFVVPVGVYSFGIEGPVGVGGFTQDIDLDSEGVNDKLDKALGFAFEFGKGKWAGQVSASVLEFDGDQRSGFLAGATPVTLEPSLDWTTAQAGVIYRAVVSNPGPKMLLFEPLGGIRYTDLEATVDVTTPGLMESRSVDIDWQEIYVGFRLAKSFTKHWIFGLNGDYGVPVSGNDESSWNAATSIGYRVPFEGWVMTVAAGYRAGGVEYADPGESVYTQDLTMDGPTLGVAFAW